MQGSDNESPECTLDSAEKSGSEDANDMIVGVFVALCIILVWANLAWLVFAWIIEEGEIRARSRIQYPEVLISATINKNRLAALRQRVRSKLIDSRVASRKREQQAEQEIVVKAPKVEEVGFLELDDQELTEGEKRRRLASALVMIGALMGVYLVHLFCKVTLQDCLIHRFSNQQILLIFTVLFRRRRISCG